MAQNPSTPAAGSSKLATFARRTVSTLALWGIVLGALFSGIPWVSHGVFLLVVLVLTALGLWEFYDLVEARNLKCYRVWGLVAGLVFIAASFLKLSGVLVGKRSPEFASDFEAGFLIVFVLGLCFRQFLSKRNPDGLTAISLTLFGLFYVPWLLNFIQKIYYLPWTGADGRYVLLYFLLVTKCSDIGAYLVGSMIGRHKMIPRISPGKTWEGLGGAILFSTLVSIAFATAAGAKIPGLGLWEAVALGVLLSLGAVIGDLIESMFKREAGVKDSGKWFPGIGGILDLLDSLLFNAPLMYLFLRYAHG